MNITTGNIQISNSGKIFAGKQIYGDTQTPGFFLGFENGVPKFHVGNSTHYLAFDGTNMALIGDLIVTGNIFANQVTATVSSSFNVQQAALPIGVYTALLGGTINATVGSTIKIDWGLEIRNSGGQAHFVIFRVRRTNDLAVVWQTWSSQGFRINAQEGGLFSFPVINAPGPGTWSYQVEVLNLSSNGTLLPMSGTVIITELKR